MAAGKAIVSTASAYASELLAGGRGRLVPPGPRPESSPKPSSELLIDAEMRAAMGRLAYEHSRGMVWWEVGPQIPARLRSRGPHGLREAPSDRLVTIWRQVTCA